MVSPFRNNLQHNGIRRGNQFRISFACRNGADGVRLIPAQREKGQQKWAIRGAEPN
jgi:hypothetical protein